MVTNSVLGSISERTNLFLKTNMEDMAALCSGKFPDTEMPPTTQDLIDICSGSFDPVTQSAQLLKEAELAESSSTTASLTPNTPEVTPVTHKEPAPEDNHTSRTPGSQTHPKLVELNSGSEIKHFEGTQEDELISQLIEDEEENGAGIGRVLYDSSDEEDGKDPTQKVTMKAKRKTLTFSGRKSRAT